LSIIIIITADIEKIIPVVFVNVKTDRAKTMANILNISVLFMKYTKRIYAKIKPINPST
jgi:hypothetical protein